MKKRKAMEFRRHKMAGYCLDRRGKIGEVALKSYIKGLTGYPVVGLPTGGRREKKKNIDKE